MVAFTHHSHSTDAHTIGRNLSTSCHCPVLRTATAPTSSATSEYGTNRVVVPTALPLTSLCPPFLAGFSFRWPRTTAALATPTATLPVEATPATVLLATLTPTAMALILATGVLLLASAEVSGRVRRSKRRRTLELIFIPSRATQATTA